ncbi:hypothetical protein [Amycolatopsis thermoflava]|uniref:hypothetical protein n=1 Tax=Amycolatopsis thermoflava TaxID=84480 RepID=UPI003F4A06D6
MPLDLTRHRKDCRSCGASIVMAASTSTGNTMPVDYTPDPQRGTVLLQVNSKGALVAGVLTRTKLAAARAAGAELRTAHHATCPHADQHRRKR